MIVTQAKATWLREHDNQEEEKRFKGLSIHANIYILKELHNNQKGSTFLPCCDSPYIEDGKSFLQICSNCPLEKVVSDDSQQQA